MRSTAMINIRSRLQMKVSVLGNQFFLKKLALVSAVGCEKWDPSVTGCGVIVGRLILQWEKWDPLLDVSHLSTCSYSPISRYSLTWFLPGNSFTEDFLSVFHSMLIKYCLKKTPFWYLRQLRTANNNFSIILIFFLLLFPLACRNLCSILFQNAQSEEHVLSSAFWIFRDFFFPCCLWTVLQETSVWFSFKHFSFFLYREVVVLAYTVCCPLAYSHPFVCCIIFILYHPHSLCAIVLL